MKLDDNTRAALHYLALGSVVIFMLAGALGVFAGYTWARPGIASSVLFPFGHGYWVLTMHDWSVNQAGSTAIDRVILAGSAAFLIGLSAGLLARVVVSAEARSRVMSRTFRIVGGVALALGLWSALLAPPCRALADANGLTITRHTTLFGDLTLPWTAHAVHVDRQAVIDIGHSPTGSRGNVIALWIRTEQGVDTIATMSDRDAPPQWADSSVAYLRDYFHRP